METFISVDFGRSKSNEPVTDQNAPISSASYPPVGGEGVYVSESFQEKLKVAVKDPHGR